MPTNPNKLSQFWQELKRRNVTRVLAVYIAAAFMILEMVNMISDPFGLPGWSFKVAFFILLAGLVIAVIVSWIYDVHPEDGIVRSEPTEKVHEELVPQSLKGWKIASYISFVVIVVLIVLNIFPRSNNNKNLDKSIAVLPFINESSDEENTFFINGLMQSILDNLNRISDLTVRGRLSVEQYRDDPKPIPIVSDELNVNYVLEGSGQKIGNRLLLSVRLTVGKDDQNIWSRQYDRDIEIIENLIDLQKEIAQEVVEEIEAIITPEEYQIIEKVPTSNLTAYYFSKRGEDEEWNYALKDDLDALDRAKNHYYSAIEHDPTFAQAYSGLASVYFYESNVSDVLTEDYLDTMLYFCDRALLYDSQLTDAYVNRGQYYLSRGNPDQAVEELRKAIETNPKADLPYWLLMANYFEQDDLVKSLENITKYISLHQESNYLNIYRALIAIYTKAGFNQKAHYYIDEILSIENDSSSHFLRLSEFEHMNGNTSKALEYSAKAYMMNADDADILWNLAIIYMLSKDNSNALKYFQEWLAKFGSEDMRKIYDLSRVGFAFLVNGYTEESNSFFKEQKFKFGKYKELGYRYVFTRYLYYDLAATYSVLGEDEKAIENLRVLNQKPRMPSWMATQMRIDPLFDSIRDEPEFQQIVRDVEAKYQAEHDRVRQWLEENDML